MKWRLGNGMECIDTSTRVDDLGGYFLPFDGGGDGNNIFHDEAMGGKLLPHVTIRQL